MMGRQRTIPGNAAGRMVAMMVAAGALAGVMAGCAAERAGPGPGQADAEPAGLLTPGDDAQADRGLEIAVWTADDTGFRVGRVLAELTTPVDAAGHEAWARSGLRILALPADRVDTLLLRAPPVGSVQRQRYAQLPIWTPLVRGPRLSGGVAGPDGRPLAPGRPRLIARAWAEPDLSSGSLGAVLRTELTIQIENAGAGGFSPDLSGRRTIALDGPIIESLLTALVGDGSEAFVIVAESPSIDWNELPAPPPMPGPDDRIDPDAPPGPFASEPGASEPGAAEPGPAAATPGAPQGAGAGPVQPGPVVTGERTLGERMLASPGIRSVDGRPAIGPRKVLMVLMPRLPQGQASPTTVTPAASAATREDPS